VRGSESGPAAPLFTKTEWIRLLVLCAAVLFEGMSLSSINLQAVDIRQDLALSPGQFQLVVSAFLATYAGLLLLCGRCADRWGRRQAFLAGTGLFGVSSLVAALAPEPTVLIVARAMQGFAAALTAPAAVALIVAGFAEGAARNRALGVFSAMGAVGFSLGVVLGGVVTQEYGWRAGFALYVPLAAVVLLVGVRVLTDARPVDIPGRIPWASALLFTAGLVVTVAALGQAGTSSAPAVAMSAGGGLVLMLASGYAQTRRRAPLVPRVLMSDQRMVIACIALAGIFAAVSGAMLLLATDLQTDRGYSALTAGLALLPQGAAVGLISLYTGWMTGRWHASQLLFAGLTTVVAGQLLYITAERGGYLAHLLPATVLVGVAIGLAYPAAVLLSSAAAGADQGVAFGVLVSCQQAGGALGVAMVTGLRSNLPGTLWIGPIDLWGCLAIALAALVVCGLVALPGSQRLRRAPS
jgi:MFS family permease